MVKSVRWWLALGLAFGVYALSEAADGKLKENILKLAAAIEKKDDKSVPKLVTAITGDKDAEIDILMVPFKLRNKEGFGVGDKAGLVRRDGIEATIQDLAKKAPSDDEAKEQGDALAKAGYVSAAIAKVIVPKNPDKKKEKLWKKYCTEYEKASLEFAAAGASKNAAMIHKAATKLDNVCISCHNDFR
ncbi:MAG: hypothetical protein AB7K24_08800 [Gemmataceae bacterium]